MSIIGGVTAYVDESLRLTGEGLYVLAAVVVPDERSAEVRATLRAAVPPGLRRYHWRKERAASRAAMTERVATLALDAIVVTGHVGAGRQERARRRCLVRLVWELGERGVTRAVFETRHHADRADRRLLADVSRTGWARELAYGFAAPEDECLLWLPDVVAGAVARDRGDCDPAFARVIAPTTTVVTLD